MAEVVCYVHDARGASLRSPEPTERGRLPGGIEPG